MSGTIVVDKRSRRPPPVFQPLNISQAKKGKPLEKKLKISACQFKLITVPPKYNDKESFLLYGNIPIMLRNDSFTVDLSILNEFHIYSKVAVTPFQNQHIISISTERKTDVRFSRWRTIVKKITEATNDPVLLGWSNTIKTFSLNHEAHMKEFCTEAHNQLLLANDSDHHLKTLAAERDQRSKKKNELLATYPCIRLHTYFRGFENRLAEVVINEKLLQTLGYSIDSFTTMTLREGLPQLFDPHAKNNFEFLKALLQHYSNTTTYDSETPPFQVTLLTRSGYTKSVTIQVHFVMNREEDENYGSDTIFVITDQEINSCLSPAEKTQQQQKFYINREFVEIMSEKEKSMCDFLWSYYGYCLLPEYMNLHKVCLIKELEKDNVKEDPAFG